MNEIDDMSLLRDFRAEVATPEPAGLTVESARLQAAITRLPAGHAAGRSGRAGFRPSTRVAVPVAIAVALLAAVVAYGAVSGSGTVDGPGPDPSQVQLVSADEVLGRAAVAANSDRTIDPRPDQFIYRRLFVRQPAVTDGGGARVIEQRVVTTWLSADASRIGVMNIEVQGTIPYPGAAPAPGGPVVVGPTGAPPVSNEMICGSPRADLRTDFDYLSSLPTDAAGMSVYLYARARQWHWAESESAKAFWAAAEMLRESYVPGPQAAALFLALAGMPGTVARSDARDVAGRASVAVTRTDQVGSQPDIRVELLFDPRTYKFLGERWVVEDGALRAGPVGSVIYGYAEMEVKVVNRPPVTTEPPPGCALPR